jgi:hypothetical protein
VHESKRTEAELRSRVSVLDVEPLAFCSHLREHGPGHRGWQRVVVETIASDSLNRPRLARLFSAFLRCRSGGAELSSEVVVNDLAQLRGPVAESLSRARAALILTAWPGLTEAEPVTVVMALPGGANP